MVRMLSEQSAVFMPSVYGNSEERRTVTLSRRERAGVRGGEFHTFFKSFRRSGASPLTFWTCQKEAGLEDEPNLMDDGIKYHIWSENMSAEGPMELPALIASIKNHRVGADTWLYVESQRQWIKAAQLPELQMFFPLPASAGAAGPKPGEDTKASIRPGILRRIKLFADMQEAQLQSFVDFMEVLSFKQFATVVTAGENSDAMYLVLEGELRARNMVEGRETTLATMTVGDFFGEVSLLDHGPRSADVVANQPSVLLKISAASVERLVRENPAAAAPFLHALSRSVVGRLRTATKKYVDSVHFSRLAGSIGN
jgi:hypothetical protein